MTEKCVALLGRRDEPTDAIEEYCKYLGLALAPHGFEMQMVRVPWLEVGWPKALAGLQREAHAWRDCWVLVQYTALAWSKRGFPSRFLRVLNALRGARIVVVYHDVEPFGGRRLIDRLRRSSQVRTMRAVQKRSVAIFTVPTSVISWRPDHKFRHEFIPVGANFPEPTPLTMPALAFSGRAPTMAVYGITGGSGSEKEVREIAEAVRVAVREIGSLRLIVFGRNSEAAEKALREKLRDVPVALRILGVLPSEEVAKTLAQADVLLFVRGEISTRRGSAIAGIACGLPVVAFAGSETAPPITEAGLALYSRETPGDLSRVLVKVLRDKEYRAGLCERSRAAQREYFSWSAIASRYAALLRNQL